jgi:RNA polymerase sigma factor (sigma-70 family)
MSMDLHAGYSEMAAYVAVAGSAPSEAADRRSEQQRLLEHAPLVKRVVRQLHAQASAVLDREDMEQIGLMGLLEALRRYGPPDERFPAFATLRIRGAILDELRRQDWRPRGVRQDSHRLRDGVRELTRRLGRVPTEGEVLQALKLSPQAYQDLLAAENAEQMDSFDEMVSELSQPGRPVFARGPAGAAPQPGAGPGLPQRTRAAGDPAVLRVRAEPEGNRRGAGAHRSPHLPDQQGALQKMKQRLAA